MSQNIFPQFFNTENQENQFFENQNLNNQNLFTMDNQNSLSKNLHSSFLNLNETYQLFNKKNLDNIFLLISNLIKAIEYFESIIKEQKINGENIRNKKDSKIDYLFYLTDNLKKQMTAIQYYSKLQKFFSNYMMKNIDNLMEQVCNQNFWKYIEQNNLMNTINLNLYEQKNDNIFNLNPIQFSIPQNIPNLNVQNSRNVFQKKEKRNINEKKFFEKMKNDVKKNLNNNHNKPKFEVKYDIYKPLFSVTQKNGNNKLFEIRYPNNECNK